MFIALEPAGVYGIGKTLGAAHDDLQLRIAGPFDPVPLDQIKWYRAEQVIVELQVMCDASELPEGTESTDISE